MEFVAFIFTFLLYWVALEVGFILGRLFARAFRNWRHAVGKQGPVTVDSTCRRCPDFFLTTQRV